MSNICSMCKVNANIIKDNETFVYKGSDLIVEGLSFYECPECGEQFADAALDKCNCILIREAKKSVDGLLSAREIYKLREKLNISQQQAAKIFGGGVNAFSKYERGEVSQSEAMDKLMRASLVNEDLFSWLCQEAGITLREKTKSIEIYASTHIDLFYSKIISRAEEMISRSQSRKSLYKYFDKKVKYETLEDEEIFVECSNASYQDHAQLEIVRH